MEDNKIIDIMLNHIMISGKSNYGVLKIIVSLHYKNLSNNDFKRLYYIMIKEQLINEDERGNIVQVTNKARIIHADGGYNNYSVNQRNNENFEHKLKIEAVEAAKSSAQSAKIALYISIGALIISIIAIRGCVSF